MTEKMPDSNTSPVEANLSTIPATLKRLRRLGPNELLKQTEEFIQKKVERSGEGETAEMCILFFTGILPILKAKNCDFPSAYSFVFRVVKVVSFYIH
ncbi:hypothetical protein D6810_02525 [Candidatus Dojkabacteria bacterium]|uniref:Uncharacterized protein n=1 Tax=Candidatus Dojkabacteria bacterium TaxID=2099670 RepID=A0A3M0Z1M0_9BACT|nr:MAG: hypothetical protein D6810_02525 [Candidatus Dojkabacteria bacterium]